MKVWVVYSDDGYEGCSVPIAVYTNKKEADIFAKQNHNGYEVASYNTLSKAPKPKKPKIYKEKWPFPDTPENRILTAYYPRHYLLDLMDKIKPAKEFTWTVNELTQ